MFLYYFLSFLFFFIFFYFIFIYFIFFIVLFFYFILFIFIFFCFFFFYFFYFLLFFFIFFIFFISFYFFLFFPYFRGNSLNSRADLEFNGIRLFFTMIFQKKMTFIVSFFEKSSWKKKKPLGFFEKNIEFQPFFLKNHRGKKSNFLKFKVNP